MTTFGLLLAALLPAVPAPPAPGDDPAEDSPPALPALPALAEPSLPTPPRQGDPWEPPVLPEDAPQLPAAAVDVARTLFEQGLADPRGCEYRQIAVVSGSVWAGAVAVETRGWVLPVEANAADQAGDEPDAPRFAVCWNGLVYPVLRIGEPADPAADVAATERTDAEVGRTRLNQRPSKGFFNVHSPWWRPTADEGLTPAQPRGVPVCLLLRLGRGDLAARLRAVPATTAVAWGERENGPYLAWAGDWLWTLFDRSIKAHVRGDDRLTLVGCRELARVHPLVEAEATRRGFEQSRRSWGSETEDLLPHVGFLNQVPVLLRDAARRVAAGPAPATLPTTLPRPAPEETRAALDAKPIPALIAWLENSRAFQNSPWNFDPLFRTLEAKGEPAIPALLDAWGRGDRLTRSVNWGRYDGRGRYRFVVPVSEVAGRLVETILHARFDTVTEARAYWAKHGDKPPADRWYDTLRDDYAGHERWLEAAGNLTRGPTGWAPRPGEAMRGEPLRGRQPSVISLLTRRAEQASGFEGRDACVLALYAGRWDPAAAGPLLTAQSRRTVLAIDAQRVGQDRRRLDGLVGQLAQLTLARVQSARAPGGESQHVPGSESADERVAAALTEYVGSLRRYAERHLRDATMGEPVERFAVLWRFPEEPAVGAAVEALFADPASPWAPLLQAPLEAWELWELFDSPMLGVPVFREQILARLADETVVATVAYEAEANDRDEARNVPDWVRPLLWLETDDPAAPPEDTERAVRVCDLYAVPLSQAEGLPRFHWYWPRADRDAARRTMIERLKQFGARYAHAPGDLPNDRAFDEHARLRFPLLDRPAEPADVAAGRAIFALEGERRIVPDLTLPRGATWTDPAKRTKRRLLGAGMSFGRSDGPGVVWQAEEVRTGDEWVRYYGFVTADGLHRVPAADLQWQQDR